MMLIKNNLLSLQKIYHKKTRAYSGSEVSIPKPVWAVGFALEQTLRDATLSVFSFLILKRLQHTTYFVNEVMRLVCFVTLATEVVL
ncbi:MAG: hypothetical protein LBH59_03410 [Planctomycetaceae bacterium]|jgi:hypothetical protein|nr:hypothetical protein [Planctomycetaceae bacterium]